MREINRIRFATRMAPAKVFSLALALSLALTLLVGLSNAVQAQEPADTFPGVRLGLIYEAGFEPALAIKPFTSRYGGGGAEIQVEAIIGRDLRYSDRFSLMDSIPAALVGEGVDYNLWDQIGATWLLTGQVEGLGEGLVLVLTLHDVVYAEVREQGRFPIPDPESEDFRMAVHRVSDEIVQWVFGEPGMAASRIAFSMRGSDGNQELYLIDSDGENLHRITNNQGLSMSPAWHPSGTKLAYNSDKTADGIPKIFELDLYTNQERMLEPGRDGQQLTPTYHPNGREIVFGIMGTNRTGIFSYDWERDCCMTHLQGGRYEDLSPTFSPDGQRIAFNSNRLGTNVPQIYVMEADGGDAELISPYVYGTSGYYTSPDWSPIDNRVAFHGRIERYGSYQILVAEVEGRRARILQLTGEGDNQDPSWAPDGRHLVFAGERRWGFGLFVVDAATGRIRAIVAGILPRNPDWSPALGSISH
jgi:TolB protein